MAADSWRRCGACARPPPPGIFSRLDHRQPRSRRGGGISRGGARFPRPDSWFLLGADLRKAPEILLPAYNDAEGVTAAFNLNLLRRLNREAGADFDLSRFLPSGDLEWRAGRSRCTWCRSGIRRCASRDERSQSPRGSRFTLKTATSLPGYEGYRPGGGLGGAGCLDGLANYFGIFLLRHA